MKWQVVISGNPYDLEYLSEIFCLPDLRIFLEGEKYCLAASSFAECPDYTSIKKETEKLLIEINAINSLYTLSQEPIRETVQGKDEKGRITRYLEGRASGSSNARVRVTVGRNDSTIEKSSSENPEKKWISLMSSNERVRRVFELMNHDFHSFPGVYKIYEVLDEDGFAPITREGEFYPKIRLFKQTSQSELVLKL